MGYLNSWEDSVNLRKGVSDKQKMMLMPNGTHQGIAVTGNKFSIIQNFIVIFYVVKSFVEIVQYLFTVPGVKCF